MDRQNDETWALLAIRMPETLRDAVKRYCTRIGVLVSDFVEAALREKLTRERRRQPPTFRRRGVARRVLKRRHIATI